ncbi:putative conserved lipoprotein LpqG [Virgisporangium aliadipatigenens]|uniref:Putative conserved lipoprotein LpqG n=1 Tax=Virgisporangium aliadipatigenens TaxID=741659 RepID=A0A8J4DQF1_9ACTN|nr:SIMPL domain-containing protein [Virgisporangium aliadipatigenens]GIJ45327.1 putative conserved lipoprotein LpqG [Virgisporangium aliadipatigenens]
MFRSRATTPALIALTVLAVLSASLPGGPAAAAANPRSAEKPLESVLVTGTGEVYGEPDTLTADFAVETGAPTVDEALNLANTAAARMRDTLRRAGLAAADLQTSHVGIGPQRDDDGTVTGYTVNQGLAATIRDLPRAGSLMSETIAAGGDAARLNGVSFAIEDDAALLTRARRNAFADARTKAETYAREAGRPLGRVVTVSEVIADHMRTGGQDLKVGAGAPLPIEPGRLRLAVTVTVEWAFQPAPARHTAVL